MTWKKAHKLNSVSEILNRFAKDGNITKAAVLQAVQNNPLEAIVALRTEGVVLKPTDLVMITKLAQKVHKLVKKGVTNGSL